MQCNKCTGQQGYFGRGIAIYSCITCDLNLCDLCWNFMHEHGSLKKHKKWQLIEKSATQNMYCKEKGHEDCILNFVDINACKEQLLCNKCHYDKGSIISFDDATKILIDRFNTNNTNLENKNKAIQNQINEFEKIINELNEEIKINEQIISENMNNINIVNDNNYINLLSLISKYYLKSTKNDGNEVIKPVFIKRESEDIKCTELTKKTTMKEIKKMYNVKRNFKLNT